MTEHPNIVLFVPDSYRGDVLGHCGNSGALTPNLDALVAKDAVSYCNAFAQNPVCTPSRCSFMTGWYPHVHGHRSMRHMLKLDEPNLLAALQQAGYYVWWGQNDLVQVQEPSDYLDYCDVKFSGRGNTAAAQGYHHPPALDADDPRRGAFYHGVLTRDGTGAEHWDQDTAWVLGATDMIRNWTGDQPFCCYLPIGKPHPPYCAEQDYYDAINPDSLPPRIPTPPDHTGLPEVLDDLRRAYRSDAITETMWRDVKRIYYAMCTKVDALFGQVVEALIERGIYDTTWILFFSDHGDFAGDYSLPEKTHSTLQDCLLRVPLIIKPPAAVPVAAGCRHHLAELLDITATLYDLLDIDPGYTHQGKSLRHSLAGDESPLHDAVFAEVGGRRGEIGFVNTDVLKMPPDSFYARQSGAAIPHHKAGSHAVTCRTTDFKYIRRCYTGHHELFDLKQDPGECRNLSGNPEYADVENQMQVRLLDFLLETTDVLPHQADSRAV